MSQCNIRMGSYTRRRRLVGLHNPQWASLITLVPVDSVKCSNKTGQDSENCFIEEQANCSLWIDVFDDVMEFKSDPDVANSNEEWLFVFRMDSCLTVEAYDVGAVPKFDPDLVSVALSDVGQRGDGGFDPDRVLWATQRSWWPHDWPVRQTVRRALGNYGLMVSWLTCVSVHAIHNWTERSTSLCNTQHTRTLKSTHKELTCLFKSHIYMQIFMFASVVFLLLLLLLLLLILCDPSRVSFTIVTQGSIPG